MFKNNSSRGFSILGLLITAAVMSGVALVAMQMTKTQTVSSTFTAAKLDESEIKRQITLVLQDSIACKKTFDSKTIGSDLNAISNANNTPIFSLGAVADTKITITSLKTKDLNAFTPSLRDVDLIVGVSKVVAGKEIKSNFNIPLKVKATGPAAPITDCFSDTSGLILAASVQSCTSLGGSWNAVTSTCALINKIKKSGDTMTGGLVITSGSLGVNSGGLSVFSGNPISTNGDLQINNAKKICVGTSCQDFSPKTCPPNEVAVGIKADGGLNCIVLPTSTPGDCVGSWSICSATCNGGVQTYQITTAASGGGTSCPFLDGAVRPCNSQTCTVPVNCIGSWAPCSKSCNGGTQVFTIVTPASAGGTCVEASLSPRSCNTQACSCIGTWGSCHQPPPHTGNSALCGGGIQEYTIPPMSGGGLCPNNNQVRSCNTHPCVCLASQIDMKYSGYPGSFCNIPDLLGNGSYACFVPKTAGTCKKYSNSYSNSHNCSYNWYTGGVYSSSFPSQSACLAGCFAPARTIIFKCSNYGQIKPVIP